MSKKIKIAVAAGVLVAIGAVAAVSHTGGSGHYGHKSGGMAGRFGGSLSKEDFDTRTRERFARFDRNNDGAIEASEVEAVIANRMRDRSAGRFGARRTERLVRAFDTDRDGRVARDEYLAGMKRRFDALDLDRDGRLTDDDLPPMMRGRKALADDIGKCRKRGQRRLAMLSGADADKDGIITPQEAAAAAETRFARFDRNKDSVLDNVDVEALRREIVEYRVRRFLHRNGAAADGRVTREQFSVRANERFARLDADGDGVISRAERPGRRPHAHGKRHGRHGGQGDGPYGPASGERSSEPKESGFKRGPGN